MAEGDGGERLEDTIWREAEEMCARYDGWTWVCADRGDHYWQLFVYGPPIYHTLVAEDGTETRCALPTPDSSHGLQVLKAAKKGTPYAEYWPDPHQQRYIMAALNGLPLLLKRVKELEERCELLRQTQWRTPVEGLPAGEVTATLDDAGAVTSITITNAGNAYRTKEDVEAVYGKGSTEGVAASQKWWGTERTNDG